MPSEGEGRGDISSTHECPCTYSFSYLRKRTFFYDSPPSLRPRPSAWCFSTNTFILYLCPLYLLSLSRYVLLPLSSVSVLMRLQSARRRRHTESPFGRDGKETREDRSGETRRRHEKAEDIWWLVANSFTDDK